jgi:hypothetical protein
MRLFASFVVALALSVPAAATAGSGLRGVVMRGPTMPVCQEGVPCSAPAKGVALLFARAGITVVARTDDAGHYRVALRPGTWTISLRQKPGIGRGLEPRSALVRADTWTTVNLSIDTGIR